MIEMVPNWELVGTWSRTRGYIYHYWKNLFHDAGIPMTGKAFHMVRRTAGTFVAKNFCVEKALL